MGTKRSPGVQYTPKGPTQGNILVDPYTGLPIHVITDGDGIRRLAVDANLTASGITVDVNLDSDNDAVAVEDPDTGAHIRVEADGSINTNTALDAAEGDNVAISAHPNQIFDEAADTITTAAFEEIYSYTSSSDLSKIIAVNCSVGTPAIVRVKIDGNIKKILRTSSLERNALFEFKEHKPLTNGQTLSVEAQVERLILSTYNTFTSIEGYIG